ncbi:ABC transporter permease [Curtobacterium sp. MCJR17_055]|uniref:ABC transporter permease n=1 Tax=unclassified Curtobacterium TaxID=257496 RepID=UPI000D89D1D8|nr:MULTISPECIES: ABC transporter permease [unclassified Curtobacterium]PYY35969.1 ABC transporter permease [Curtobacterium sp. MCBD17_029]PYY40849.1 ABC transporter permease [Curtobacterium sp. MCPF17_046]PYY50056.1 ABC transporter permease [Curtobacterium sp. MCBD17_023]PYY54931.1 ABC transporter permease [Curtobacterium sp. MCJR17_055]PYY61167.1 ABC transporter permease [Curtobacterium sp. MCPF17_015]
MSNIVSERFERLRQERMAPAGRPATAVLGSIREVFAHRQLLDLLIRRDLKSRYKDSALGFAWTLIRPLVQLAIYYFVLGQILGASRNIPEFAIYVFSGLTLYGLFSEIVASGTASIVSNGGLIKKVYLPREIYPLASVGAALFNFGVQLVVLLAAAVLQSGFDWVRPDLLYFFPATLVILIWATALALLLAAANVYLRDMQYLVEVLVLLLMWGSPIVYSWQMVSNAANTWLLNLYTANPITLAVLGIHRAFWTAGNDSQYPSDLLLRLAVAGVVGLVALVACQRVFAKLQGNFAQEI